MYKRWYHLMNAQPVAVYFLICTASLGYIYDQGYLDLAAIRRYTILPLELTRDPALCPLGGIIS